MKLAPHSTVVLLAVVSCTSAPRSTSSPGALRGTVDKLAVVPNEWLPQLEAWIVDAPPPPATANEPWFRVRTRIVSQSAGGDLVTNALAMDRRVRWEVSENELVARDANGVVAGVFAIDSQYDVQHAYAPTLDPACNTFQCDDPTEPPWQVRRFLRVDWSRNLMDTIDTLESPSATVTSAEPLPMFVNDPNDPNALHVYCGTDRCDPEPITVRSTSFTFTNRAIVHLTLPDGSAAPLVEVTLEYEIERE